MPLSIFVERARGLPRSRLLRAPSPYAEVHYFAGGPPVGVSAPVAREPAPEWPGFVAEVSTAPADSPPRALGVVVRDAGAAGALLGRAHVRVAASVTEGWFALEGADGAAVGAAEVYVRVEWPEYVRLARWARPVPEVVEADGDLDSELRAAADEPGRFFRCGEVSVAVRAAGVPVATRDPQLAVKTHDQHLRGYEAAEAPDSPSAPPGGAEERVFRPVLTKEEYGAAKKAGTRREVDFGVFTLALFQGLFPDTLQLSIRERGAHNLHAVTALLKSVADQTIPLPTRIPGFDDSLVKAGPGKGTGAGTSTDTGTGSGSGAGTGAGAGAGAVAGAGTGAGAGAGGESAGGERDGEDAASSYVMHFRATSPGAPGDKVIFDVRVTYTLWRPPASCNVVTPRFRELMADMCDLAPVFKQKYPVADSLTYLFVGGLFTNHYPKYFFFNNSFLQETIGLSNVGTIPVHTEASVQSNARTIRDAVVEAAGGTRSVVLISHSKGGCDVCGAIARYPELEELLFGCVAYQAPFAGTYLVGFVSKRAMAINVIAATMKKLWGGERDAFTDMGYASRLRDVLFGGDDDEADVNSEEKEDAAGHEKEDGDGEKILNLKAKDADETDLPDAMGSLTVGARTSSGPQVAVLDDESVSERLRMYGGIPCVSFASSFPYVANKVRSVANAAGFASMAPSSQIIAAHTGFHNDGLVAPCDARIPYSDLVYLTDMMHTEPALFFMGTKYPPGELTAAGIALLIEKNSRKSESVLTLNTR